MRYEEFVGQVHHRGRVSSGGEAVKAIQAIPEIPESGSSNKKARQVSRRDLQRRAP
jgi:hypothetical protein